MKLTELQINMQGKINKLNCIGNIRRRLLDLGITKGSIIKPVFKSPFTDPIAYEIRGSLIALRNEDSDNIDVIIYN